MKLTDLAVKQTDTALADGVLAGGLKLEFLGKRSDQGLQLELLHDDRAAGTFARVFAGQVGTLAVAIKLQRDAGRNLDSRSSIAAKMDGEHNVHRRLQAEGAPEAPGRRQVVEQLEIWSPDSATEADFIPPCILCVHARQGLAPRCPSCAGVLAEQQTLDGFTSLCCPKCGTGFLPESEANLKILTATSQHDEACVSCEHRHDPARRECQRSTTFLSFYANRVLLLERLDLDLEDYLNWSRTQLPPSNRPRAAKAFQQHRQALEARSLGWPPMLMAVDRLTRAVEVFAAVLDGVRFLHQHQVAHLDLKPANICLRLRGADLEVKVIDLGLSADAAALAFLRQAAGPVALGTEFTAPEFRRMPPVVQRVRCRFRPDGCEVVWTPPPADDTVRPGDLLLFSVGGPPGQAFRVVWTSAEANSSALTIHARAENPGHSWDGQVGQLPWRPTEPESPTDAVLANIEPYCGYPADVFSLGLLLLALLTNNLRVRDTRELLDNLRRHLNRNAAELEPLPARALVRHVLDALESSETGTFLAGFRPLYAELVRDLGEVTLLGEELLGLVLRATVRGDSRLFYLEHRSSAAGAALDWFQEDLEAIRRALQAAQVSALARLEQQRRLQTLAALAPDETVRSPFEGRFAYPHLDLAAASRNALAREQNWWKRERRAAEVLRRWRLELAVVAAPSWAEPLLSLLTRYSRQPPLNRREVATAFLSHIDREAAKSPHARWLTKWRTLADRLRSRRELVPRVRACLSWLSENLFQPWDMGLAERVWILWHARSANVKVPLNALQVSGLAELREHLRRLQLDQNTAQARDQQRATYFQAEAARWSKALHRGFLLKEVAALRDEVVRQEEHLAQESAAWDKVFADCTSVFQQFHDRVAPLLEEGTFMGESLRLNLPGNIRKEVDELVTTVIQATDWLEQNWPAPGDAAEASQALWELEEMALEGN